MATGVTAYSGFFCSNNFLIDQPSVAEVAGPVCFNSTGFLADDLQKVCPSGNCIEDCVEIGTMYDDVPQAMYSAEIPLYAICTGAANITRQTHDGYISIADEDALNAFFPQSNESIFEAITATTTSCLSATCEASRYAESCRRSCSGAHLLINGTTPSLQGQSDCLTDLCGSTEFFPFADQDIIGIGVSASYIIQGVLALIVWLGFTVPEVLHRLWHNEDHSLSDKLRKTLVEANEGFHKAQCYFDISLAIAALFSFDWAFMSDPLNAYILLIVMANGVLSPTITYLLVYRYGRRSWYIDLLTFVNFTLTSVVVWGLQYYLRSASPTAASSHLQTSIPQATSHMSSIESCGGSSALNLCIWATGLSPFRNFFGWSGDTAIAHANTVAFIWSVCAACQFTMFGIAFSNLLRKLMRSPHPSSAPTPTSTISQISKHLPHTTPSDVLGKAWAFLHRSASSLIFFLLISAALVVCVTYQAILFRDILNQKVINLSEWAFGQIIAVVVWIPPVVEFIEAILVDWIEMRRKRGRRSSTELGLRSATLLNSRPPRLQSVLSQATTAEPGNVSDTEGAGRPSWEVGDDPGGVESTNTSSADVRSPEEYLPPRRRTTRFLGEADIGE